MLYSKNLDEVLPLINSIGTSAFLVDVVADGSFRFFAFNQREEEDVGLTTAQVNGKRPEDILSQDHARRLNANYARCVKSRTEIEVDTYMDTPEGRRWAYNRLIPIFDEAGQIVRIMGTVIETTGQRRAEQRSRVSESKYRALFDQSREAIVITNTDGVIVEVNPIGLAYFGYDQEEIVGQDVALLYAEDVHRDDIRQRLLMDGYARDEEVSIRRKDGSIRLGLLTVTRLIDENEQPYLHFGIFRDITERKSIENTLYFVAQYHRKSEAFFADLLHYLAQTLDVIHAYIGELSQEGKAIHTIAYYDHGSLGENIVYALQDTPCDNVVGQSLCHFPQQIQKIFPKDARFASLNAESYVGVPLWKSDGQALGIIALMDEKPLQNPDLAETLLQIVAVRAAHELERQQDEQTLKASEARYRAIVEDQTEFIVRWKPDTTRTFVNEAYSRYFKQPIESMIGTSFAPLITAEDQAAIRQKVAAISPQSPYQTETHRGIAPDGEVKWHEWTHRGIFDSAEELIELQSVGRDVTDRKQAEEALEYYGSLQSMITTLATEFINIPPQKIDETIHHALQAIGEFVGASRCTINMYADDLESFSRTHEWYAEEVQPFLVESQNVPFKNSGAEWARQYFGKGDFVIPNIADLPAGTARVKTSMAQQGAQAMMAVEMHFRDSLIGFITLQFPKPHPLHADDTFKLLHVVGETFMNALDRKRRDEEIRTLTAELEQRVAERTAAFAESEQKFRSISEQAVMGILILREGKIVYANQAVEEITKHPPLDLLAWDSRHYYNFVHPDDLGIFSDILERPTASEQPGTLAHIEYRAFTRDRDVIWIEQFSRSIMFEGQPAVLAMIVDITDRKQAEEGRKQQRKFMEALLDAAIALSSTLRSEKLIEPIFHSMQGMVKYETATILLKNDDEFFEVLARYGYPEERANTGRFPLREFKYIRRALDTGQPIFVPDTRSDPNFANHPEHLDLNASYLFVPIILAGKTTGILTLGSTTLDFFQPQDAEFLQIFAQQAGLALRNAQLYGEAQTLAALQERQRLARDLHDSVSQTLYSALTLAELAPRLLDTQPEKAREYLADVQQLNHTALAEMRTLLMELRPDALARTELGILLRQLCDVLKSNLPLHITFTVTDKIILPEEEQIVFYRVAQEALNNIAKHAHATQVRVELDKSDEEVRLCILDDGPGFVQDQIAANHFGLKIMQERAESIGADLRINSKQGTEIILSRGIA